MKNMRCCILFAVCFCLGSISASAQQLPPATIQGDGKDSARSIVFDTVEVEPSVDRLLWRKHLESQLGPFIVNAAKRGLKPGQYIVNVRFLVEKDGSISDAKALQNPGFGLAKGAEKVVKTGPKWTPGQQNGMVVRSYHTQPIAFVVSE
jgi:protein TonB